VGSSDENIFTLRLQK